MKEEMKMITRNDVTVFLEDVRLLEIQLERGDLSHSERGRLKGELLSLKNRLVKS